MSAPACCVEWRRNLTGPEKQMPRTRTPRARREPPAAAPPKRKGRATIVLPPAVFALVFTGLEVFSYTRTSATWDEPIHLADGYFSASAGDYRVDPEHPPLLRMWAALPLLVSSKVADAQPIDAAAAARAPGRRPPDARRGPRR
jgi:hypothetical protein